MKNRLADVDFSYLLDVENEVKLDETTMVDSEELERLYELQDAVRRMLKVRASEGTQAFVWASYHEDLEGLANAEKD